MEFLAKSDPKESIEEHTLKLIDNYNLLKNIYPNIKYLNWDILRLACLYHDLGKINTKFQNKIRKDKNYKTDKIQDYDEVYHNFLSPAFLPKNKLKSMYSKDELRILYQSIYKHHERRKSSYEDIKRTIEADLENIIDGLQFEELNEIDLSEGLSGFNTYIKKDILKEDGVDTFYQYVLTKGLLNKIDYAASTYVSDKAEEKSTLKVEIKNKNLKTKVNEFFIKNGHPKNKLQEYMQANVNENNIVIASTGIGKTEAALLWIENCKGFFTLPLRVSINAIYDRIKGKKEKNSINFSDVALLHSSTYSEYLHRSNEIEFSDYYYASTKQLSMPLTVCTLDQLIDFIFLYPGFEVKLAAMAYSKLVIDEIQMYTADYLAYIIVGLKYITDVGGKFSIVTATFPPVLEHFIKKNNIPYKKAPLFLKEEIRHKVEVLEEVININKIKENYKNKKVLVICNTIKKAQEIYTELKKAELNADIKLLHARFIKSNRKKLENEILEMGKEANTTCGIWVTTQIVEASLDIDFDVLYTELSEVCGLFQRMGRVFRKRELKDKNTNVYVYLGNENEFPSGISNGKRTVVDIKLFNNSKKELLNSTKEIYDEKLKINIVENVYSIENLKDSDFYRNIKSTIEDILNIQEFEFDKKYAKLRNIQTKTIIPRRIYEENKAVIKDIICNLQNNKGKENKKIRELEKDRLSEFFVNIYPYMAEGKKNDFEIIDDYNRFEILDIEYDDELGILNQQTSYIYEKDNEDNFF